MDLHGRLHSLPWQLKFSRLLGEQGGFIHQPSWWGGGGTKGTKSQAPASMPAAPTPTRPGTESPRKIITCAGGSK